MAPLVSLSSKNLLLLFSILFFLFASLSFTTCTPQPHQHSSSINLNKRRILESSSKPQKDEENFNLNPPLKKKPTTNKNTTKLLIKPSLTNLSSKNQTKKIKSNTTNINLSSKIQTLAKTNLTDTNLKKNLNSTKTTLNSKKLNNSTSTKKPNNSSISSPPKKPLDLTKTTLKKQSKKIQQPSTWLFDEEDAELVSEFKDLPVKFQQTLIPDLEKISTTSKAYITKANKEITKNFKPYVGNKYAPTIAVLLSLSCVLIPFIFVSLLFNKIKAYFSLQKLLIFIQIYLSIYFTILSLSSLLTGLEPLKFFYSTSQSTYVCLQILQTLGYVLYLLLLLMNLVLVFSTDCGLGSRLLGLAQTFVGFAVGLHYYMTVFHKVVLRQAPKTNWKVHGIYATCFVLICLLARAERRKKTYLEEGGEEGKKN